MSTSCSMNSFDKSAAKCTLGENCYRWDIWGSANAFDSEANSANRPSHPFPDSSGALFGAFLHLACQRGEINREIFRLFSPSGVWHFVRHCVKLSLGQSGRNHLFCNFRPNSVPRSFPTIEAALLSLLIVALPPLSPGKRNKEGSQKMRQRRYVGGWNYEIANWATARITIVAPGGDSQFHVDR